VLNTRQVVEITGKHRVTIYRWIRDAGISPEKHESRGHKVGWIRSDIEAWLHALPADVIGTRPAPADGIWALRLATGGQGDSLTAREQSMSFLQVRSFSIETSVNG